MTDTLHPAGEPGRRDPLIGVTRRVTSWIVLWLWSVLRWRSDADRWHVYVTALASANQKTSGRIDAHLRVLYRFMEATDNAPVSRRSYTRFRDAQADRDELPSATAIANTFGGWPQAAEAIGQSVTPDVLARRLTANGPRMTRDSLLAALQTWLGTGPADLHYRSYRAWAFARNEQPQESLGVVPVGRMTFHRVFGGWWESLYAAGAIDEHELARRKTGSPDDRPSHETTVEWLRAFAAEVAPRRLTADAYGVLRSQRLDAGLAAPPGVATITHRFGTWHEALGAAGLLGEHEVRAGLRKGGRRATDAHVLWSVRTAIATLGEDLTRRRYRAWRLRIVERGEMKPLPVSDAAIVSRLGGWSAAVERALGEGRS